eukprot:Tamp_13312.p2 GENE.Tamp_13312~~Tamp_13312.p2  ORF type:complete len:275 (+),score=8.02 Tamp_13312:125-826(+)
MQADIRRIAGQEFREHKTLAKSDIEYARPTPTPPPAFRGCFFPAARPLPVAGGGMRGPSRRCLCSRRQCAARGRASLPVPCDAGSGSWMQENRVPAAQRTEAARQNTASERARRVEGRRRGRPRCFQMTVFTGSRFLHRVSAKNPVQNLCESLSNLCKHSLAAKTVCVCDYGHHSHTFTLPSGHSLTLTHLRTTAAPPTHATYNHFHRQFAPVLPVTSCRILEHSFVDLNLCT